MPPATVKSVEMQQLEADHALFEEKRQQRLKLRKELEEAEAKLLHEEAEAEAMKQKRLHDANQNLRRMRQRLDIEEKQAMLDAEKKDMPQKLQELEAKSAAEHKAKLMAWKDTQAAAGVPPPEVRPPATPAAAPSPASTPAADVHSPPVQKRAFSPLRATTQRDLQEMSPLTRQLAQAEMEELQLQNQLKEQEAQQKKAKLAAMQTRNARLREKLHASAQSATPTPASSPSSLPASSSTGSPAAPPTPAVPTATSPPVPVQASSPAAPAAAPNGAPPSVPAPPKAATTAPPPPPLNRSGAPLDEAGLAGLLLESTIASRFIFFAGEHYMRYISTCFQASAVTPAKAAAAAVQQVRRLCANPHRCTFEVLQAWRAQGSSRKNLIKEYIESGDVNKVTVDLIMADLMRQLGA